MATLHLMVGLPAAGKTTHAKQLASQLGAFRLTPDEWMIPLFADNDAEGKRDVLEGRSRSRPLAGAVPSAGCRRAQCCQPSVTAAAVAVLVGMGS